MLERALDITSASPQQDLDELAARVRAADQGVAHAAANLIEYALAAGDALLSAKEKVGHGAWLSWLRSECDISEDRAERYMRIARGRAVLEAASSAHMRNLSLTGALTLIKEQEPRSRTYSIHREGKLGADTIAKIRATSLDSAAEMDELIMLNRGVALGELTSPVKQLVALAAAGEAVSAVAYTKNGAAFRHEEATLANSGTIALQDADAEVSAAARKAAYVAEEQQHVEKRADKSASRNKSSAARYDTEPDSASKTTPTPLEHFETQCSVLRSENGELRAALASKLAGVSNERLVGELKRRLPARKHQPAIETIARALDAPGQHNGPTLDLEADPITDNEMTKH